MSYTIVVARYNENVEWTKPFSNVVIFNKGEKLDEGYNEHLLENVGREGHTYYNYICENYDKLSDYTIFLQGHPFDHSPNLIDNLHRHINTQFTGCDFVYLSEHIKQCKLSGCQFFYWIPMRDIYESLFGERREEMEFTFGCGAQFIVSKTAILKRPKTFYSKIVDILKRDWNPIEGHFIERFHKIIFHDLLPG